MLLDEPSVPKKKIIQVVPQHQLLVMPNLPQFRTVLPHGRALVRGDREFWVVKHGVTETVLLNRLGAGLPCPMAMYYRWARMPWRAQQETASMLISNRRAYVLNEMGLGKSYTALAAIDFLMDSGVGRRALIVAPLSTLGPTWRNELARWFPHRTCAILHGSAETRRKLLSIEFDFYVINHDGVEIIIDDLKCRQDINMVVFDELAVYRNGRPKVKNDEGRWEYRNRRWSFAQELVKGRDYVWGLTGAPCPNEPLDAWAQVRLITPERVSWSWSEFRNRVMSCFGEHVWLARDDAMETVYSVMQPAMRHKLADSVDLPPVIEETRQIAMSKQQQRAYEAVLAEIKANIHIMDDNGQLLMKLDSVNEAVQLNKLCQIACGYAYDNTGATVDLRPADRLNELLNVIQEASHKVIVFVPYLGAIAAIVAFLTKHKISCVEISSRTSVRQRNAIFSAFQETPTPRVIVAHPGTMSHGLTLTAANVIVWYAPVHSLDTYIQANRRITRPGQKNRQVLVHLSGAPVEALIYKRLHKRQKFLGVLLELFERKPNTQEIINAQLP